MNTLPKGMTIKTDGSQDAFVKYVYSKAGRLVGSFYENGRGFHLSIFDQHKERFCSIGSVLDWTAAREEFGRYANEK